MKIDAGPFRSSFYVWNGVSAVFFSSCVTKIHSHSTIQIILDLHEGFKCKVNYEEWRSYRQLIIRERAIHQLDTNDSVQLIIYLDAESAAAMEIKEKYLSDKQYCTPDFPLLSGLDPEELQRVILRPDPNLLFKIIGRVLSILTTTTPDQKKDPRIIRVMQMITEFPPSKLSVKYLASQVCMSESRLRVLFKQCSGSPIYKYIIWARVRFAVSKIMAGHTVQDAAFEAGFIDGSHFHKMMISMFGISPSQFIKDNSTFRMEACDQSMLNFETLLFDY